MLLPLVVFVALLVFIVSFDRAALQVKLAGDRAVQIYREVARALAKSSPGEYEKILNQRRELVTGWHFVVVEKHEIQATTLPLDERHQKILTQLPPASEEIAGYDELLMGTRGNWYYVSPIEVPGWDSGSYLICLEPYQSIAATITGTFRESAWLAFGICCALICAAALYSNHLSRRVEKIQQQVQRIAAGDWSQMADERGRDEISQLAKSVNVMAADLESMKHLVQDAERSRLHAQLAGGIAHELRNGIHAARLSLEVFHEVNEGCSLPSLSMLVNAHDQLKVTETLVRRLLSVGKPQHEKMTRQAIREVILDVSAMVETICKHAEVHFRSEIPEYLSEEIEDSESMQAAILNLCLNAVEAAGRHGDIHLSCQKLKEGIEILVSDSGPGPDDSIANSLFEPFMTTKPQGIGLGLVQVQKTAQEAGGHVDWKRENDRTVFIVWLPVSANLQPEN